MSSRGKCPPGVICIENMSFGILIIIVLTIIMVIYLFSQQKNRDDQGKEHASKVIVNNHTTASGNGGGGWGWGGWFGIPSFPYTSNDVLLNPYAPPLRDERYIMYPPPTLGPIGSVPINVQTNIGAVETNYRQVGLLRPVNGAPKDNLLAFMGRPVFTNRNKWQYYTISNQHNNVKLPLIYKGRNASNEYGVDQIMNGDVVYVEGMNEPYRVTMYENDTIRYLPFI